MNKFKLGLTGLVVAAALPFALQAQAAGDQMPPDYFSGFYGGLGVGVSDMTANLKSSGEVDIGDPVIDALSANHSADLGDAMVMGNIFVGYGMTFQSKYYLGAEIFGRYSPLRAETKNETDVYGDFSQVDMNAKLSNDFVFGGLIRGGYLISPKTLLYVLVGVNGAPFKHEWNASGVDDATDIAWQDKGSKTSTKAAIMPGVGIEEMITSKLSLRAQYTYSFYFGDITHSKAESGTLPGPYPYTVGDKQTIKNLANGSFDVDLSYHFNGL